MVVTLPVRGRRSRSARDRGPVAPQPRYRFLGLGQDRGGQRRVVGLAEDTLTRDEPVAQEPHDALGGRFAAGHAGLAHVLVDDDERLRADRVGARRRRVLDLEAEVGGYFDPFSRGAGGGEGWFDVLARLVLHAGVREFVLQRVGLLHVADRAGRLLDRAGHARVALAAGARRPLHVLAFADLAVPFGVHRGEEAGEAGRRAGGVRAVDPVSYTHLRAHETRHDLV